MHELTEKISDVFKVHKRQVFKTNRQEIEEVSDSIIREWLEEKVDDILKHSHTQLCKEFLDNYLGLSPKAECPEHQNYCCFYDPKTGQGAGHTGPCKPEKETPVWCEHIKEGKDEIGYSFGGAFVPSYQFCPICGTPKPQEKTLEKKFMDEGIRLNWFKKNDAVAMSFCSQLARIAADHFNHPTNSGGNK